MITNGVITYVAIRYHRVLPQEVARHFIDMDILFEFVIEVSSLLHVIV